MGISSALGSSALLPAGLGFRNKIINGGFDIWQRGTSFTNPTAGGAFYTADRWGFNRFLDANGTTISRSTDAPTGQRYSLKWQRTAGDTGTGEMDGWYAVETADSIPLAGQQVVLSFWAKKGANYSGGALSSYVHYGTGTDQREYAFTGRTTVASGSHTLSTSWQLFTIYGVVPSSATQVGLQFAWNPTGTAGADDSVYIDRVQLEANYQPTPFEQRPIGIELALCQRYYWKWVSANSGDVYVASYIPVGGRMNFTVPLPVPMRTRPTSATLSGSWTAVNSTSNISVYDRAINWLILQGDSAVSASFSSGFYSTSGSSTLVAECEL